MSEDLVKVRGTSGAFKPNPGGQVEIPYPVKGLVKDNIDAARTGRIRVYIEAFSGLDPDVDTQWVTVNYLSPFFGHTPGTIEKETSSLGTFKENPHSYGFWTQPPDLETEVICIFINGKKDFGYYIGCIPAPGLLHMVPAIGATNEIVAESGADAKAYGGAKILPTVEMQPYNKELSNSPNPYKTKKPIHKRVATQLFEQGLIKDQVRGSITSSSMRESPSRVLGISTPGRPIYKGGIDGKDEEIAKKVMQASDDDLKITGRRGGHSFVMDDGDFDGKNNLMRLRTSAGHQITMSDDGQTIFVIHSNGQSWIELGKEGTIDMFCTNSVNVRTQGDLNLHADRNINVHAKEEFNMFAKKITINSEEDTNLRVGKEYKQHTVGDHTLKVDKKMSFDSAGDASMASSAISYVNGSKVNLNTGSTSLKPAQITPFTPTKHSETTFDKEKGWTSCPSKLCSITTRTPTHTPWSEHNKGVCCKGSCSGKSSCCSTPSSSVSSCTGCCGGSCGKPVPEEVVKTVPETKEMTGSPTILEKNVVGALTAQSAVNAHYDPLTESAKNNNGVAQTADGKKIAILGKFNHTPTHLETTGYLKAGSASLAQMLIQKGFSLQKAMPSNIFTGKDNITNLTEFLKSTKAQLDVEFTLMQQGIREFKKNGLITGNESPTQLGGIALTSAKYGSKKAMDFVKTTSGTNTFNSKDPMVDTFASGTYASTLADKSLSPEGKILSSLNYKPKASDSYKNSYTILYELIKASNQDLKQGPQDLSVSNNALDIKSSSEVNLSQTKKVVDKPVSDIFNTKEVKRVNLKAAVYDGLDDSERRRIDQLLTSLNVSQRNSFNFPISGSKTLDRSEINEQVRSLVGPGVPVSQSASDDIGQLKSQYQVRYEELSLELKTLEAQKGELSVIYERNKNLFGASSAEFVKADADYKDVLLKIRQITEEMNLIKSKLEIEG
jgi:hypothetical protein